MHHIGHYSALMGISDTVGEVVRSERTGRGWSLDRAASRLGVSRRLLTKIESGTANPSLSTLQSIADGFGIDLTRLISGVASSHDVVLQRDNAEADVLWSTEAGSWARLLVGKGPLELWSWRLEPGDTRRSAAHSAGSLEALIVTLGTVEIDLDGSGTTPVGAGQSLIFTARHAHEYRNSANVPAEFHLAVFVPIDDQTAH
jgi:transcriptional regulator with XRE-family HTH domain